MTNLEMAHQCARDTLDAITDLPVAVSDMTPNEYKIYLTCAALTGSMCFIVRQLEEEIKSRGGDVAPTAC